MTFVSPILPLCTCACVYTEIVCADDKCSKLSANFNLRDCAWTQSNVLRRVYEYTWSLLQHDTCLTNNIYFCVNTYSAICHAVSIFVSLLSHRIVSP
jgi:hypothetical protein